MNWLFIPVQLFHIHGIKANSRRCQVVYILHTLYIITTVMYNV